MPRRIERERNRVIVGILSIELYIPGRRSLKEKRYALRKILDRIRNEFNVSVAETGYQDLWQRSGLGMAMVSNDRVLIESTLDQIARKIDLWGDAQVILKEMEWYYG